MKKALITQCKEELEARKAAIAKDLENLNVSLGAETKSSAGDKYETSREMMNQEIGKLQQQVAGIHQQLGTLSIIDADKKCKKVTLGAIVKTSMGNFFITISYGKLTHQGEDYLLISAIAPIAQQMINKKVGDKINRNGKDILIEEIC